MPPITVTVTWPANAPEPSVDVDPIVVPKGSGATVIRWTSGPGVSALQIIGLPADVFSPPTSNAPVPNFSTTDANRVAGDYAYTVTAVRSGGRTAQHDPRIQNGG
jgi:hypothetical protein